MNTNRRNMPYNPNNPGVRQNMPAGPNDTGERQNMAAQPAQPQPRLAPMVDQNTYPHAGAGRSQAAAGYSKQFSTSPGRDSWGRNFDEAFQRKYDLMERGQDMGFDTSARGQDHDMFRHADDHGLKTQMHELTGRMHDENLGFKQGQHEDNYAHARAQLNQQGTQFDKTFNREGERHGIEDKRYDDKDYDARQQLETTNEEARRRLEMDEGKAMRPSLVTTYDEHGQRQSTEVPGLQRGQDGRLGPPQAQPPTQQDQGNDLLNQYLEENNRLRNRGLFGRIFNR